MLNQHKKFAFTLAEVLITLGIIGVVAALTLPTLIQNHKKQALKSQLQKVINTFNNVMSMAVAQEGVSDFCGTKLHDVFGRAGYDCVAGNACQDIDEEIKKYLKYVSVDDEQYPYKYTWSQQTKTTYFTHRMVLSDGTLIFWSNNSGNACVGCSDMKFYVDLNGVKGPNIIGKDMHELSIYVYNWTSTVTECDSKIRSNKIQNAFDAIDRI